MTLSVVYLILSVNNAGIDKQQAPCTAFLWKSRQQLRVQFVACCLLPRCHVLLPHELKVRKCGDTLVTKIHTHTQILLACSIAATLTPFDSRFPSLCYVVLCCNLPLPLPRPKCYCSMLQCCTAHWMQAFCCCCCHSIVTVVLPCRRLVATTARKKVYHNEDLIHLQNSVVNFSLIVPMTIL